MLLSITHRTEYSYDAPVAYALQRVRLFPLSGRAQTVRNWTLDIEGAREEVRFEDHFGNDTRLLSVHGGATSISIVARGEVETHDASGVFGAHRGFAPLWLFRQQTPLTVAGEGIVALARKITDDGDMLVRLHELMHTVRERMPYTLGETDSETTAEEALSLGKGVCQDHTHVFLSAARHLGVPARYASGYLKLDATDEQTASHAWAEAHVDGLGWVGFDCSNGISPDERYVRIAVGRDYGDAMPVSGIRHGSGREHLAVHIMVEQ